MSQAESHGPPPLPRFPDAPAPMMSLVVGAPRGGRFRLRPAGGRKRRDPRPPPFSPRGWLHRMGAHGARGLGLRQPRPRSDAALLDPPRPRPGDRRRASAVGYIRLIGRTTFGRPSSGPRAAGRSSPTHPTSSPRRSRTSRSAPVCSRRSGGGCPPRRSRCGAAAAGRWGGQEGPFPLSPSLRTLHRSAIPPPLGLTARIGQGDPGWGE